MTKLCKIFKLALLVIVMLPSVSATASELPQTTWHERKFRNMIPQELEISCGAATIATLLNFYGGLRLTEENILTELVDTVPPELQDKVLQYGFNLLQLKQAVLKFGFTLKAANTYNDQLVRFGSPALLQIKTSSGHHFVVWHGKTRGQHWLGDPSQGDIWMSDLELEREWTGVAAWLFDKNQPLPKASPEKLERAYLLR